MWPPFAAMCIPTSGPSHVAKAIFRQYRPYPSPIHAVCSQLHDAATLIHASSPRLMMLSCCMAVSTRAMRMAVLCKILDELTGYPGDALSTGVSPRMDLGLQLSGAAEIMHGRPDSHMHQPRLMVRLHGCMAWRAMRMAVYCKIVDEHMGCPRDVLFTGGSQGIDLDLQLSGSAVGKYVRSEQSIIISAASELTQHKSHVCGGC